MKKKIAFYIESMIVGGAEKVLIDLVNNIDPEKFDITVIALFKKSVYSDYEFHFKEGFAGHIRYRYLIDNTNTLKYRFFNFLYNRMPKTWMYRRLVKERFDIEVAFYEGAPTEFVSYSGQPSKKIAWLHTHQERLYEDLDTRSFEKKRTEYARYQHIIGVSEDVCSSFRAIFDYKTVKCLYNPVDEKKIFHKVQQGSEIRYSSPLLKLVTVGRLVPVKSYDRLLNVLGLLKEEGFEFRLMMVGDGEQKTDLENLIFSKNLQEIVTLLGHLDNPYPFICQADCLVMSSLFEGLSTVVIESLILETPVITTDCSGMSELIEDKQTGLICENSEEGLYSALKYVLEHPEVLAKYRRNIQATNTVFYMSNRMQQIEKVLLN